MKDEILKKMEAAGFGKIEIDDKDIEVKPINGKYVCRLLAAGNVKGYNEAKESDYDFWTIKAKVEKDVRGDKGVNRRAERIISFVDNDYGTAKEYLGKYIGWLDAITEGSKELNDKLVKILDVILAEPELESGELIEKVREPLNELSKECVGLLFKAKVSPAKDKDGNIKRDGNFPKQNILPMKKFMEKGKEIEVDMTDNSEEVPF